jgi:hypothetical protein
MIICIETTMMNRLLMHFMGQDRFKVKVQIKVMNNGMIKV